MTNEGIVYALSSAEVAECIELIGAAISQPGVTSVEAMDAGVAENLDTLANVLGWTAEEVAATWAMVSAIVEESRKKGRQ